MKRLDHRVFLRLVAFLATATISTAAAAQEAELIGGRPAPAGAFPATVYASMAGGRCSATVVGERTLLIAAHCVDSGGTASFGIGANNYTARCAHSPNYPGDSTADWSLCLVDRKVEGIAYENVNVDASRHVLGQEVLLTGYGCINPGGGGGNDGIYRIGEARVIDLPDANSNDLVTRGSSALCFGDSGGPAFLYLDAAKTKRILIAVNSRGDIQTTSYLSSISTAMAKSFLTNWSARNSTRICGMHADAAGCRDAAPSPTLPAQCTSLGTTLATWTSCMTSEPKPTRSACDTARNLMSACYAARYP